MTKFAIPIQPDFTWRANLANLLLDCPSLQTSHARAAVISQLSKNVKNSLNYSPVQNAKQDVLNIIDLCLTFPTGLNELVKVVQFFDEDTTPLTSLLAFLNQKRLFLSYKRDAVPDTELARQLYDHFNKTHKVFIDQENIRVGSTWRDILAQELAACDFLIVLLSENSIGSEMVQYEIETIRSMFGEGKRILPVRVNYRAALEEPISLYLRDIQWVLWQNENDTTRVVAELEKAIAGGALGGKEADLLPTPAPLLTQSLPLPTPSAQMEPPEGTMKATSVYYIERREDKVGRQIMGLPGQTITIKGSRQVGKSSLLLRLRQEARKAGKRVVFLDFQQITKQAILDPELFYQQFCAWLSSKLDLEDKTDDRKYWSPRLGLNQRCTDYMERYILRAVAGSLTLAMDEVDTIFDASFRSDFFGMLRSWHNNRSDDEREEWEKFDLLLVTSTEPYQLISDLTQSPFNVGETLTLADFDSIQVEELNRRHGQPFTDGEVKRLFELLGGHPYLTRKAFYLVASSRFTPSELFQVAGQETGPFGDHLRYHFFRFQNRPDLTGAIQSVLKGRVVDDQQLLWRLRGAGLIRMVGRDWQPRSELYASYFREHLQ